MIKISTRPKIKYNYFFDINKIDNKFIPTQILNLKGLDSKL